MTKLANSVIPVEDASIQIRQVTVEVLTLDKRQVTQSLYKQLLEEDVVSKETGRLKGTVWGWINLHDKDCDADSEHLHVIWEDSGRLKRSHTQFRCSHVDYISADNDFDRTAQVYMCLMALEDKGEVWSAQTKTTFQVKGWESRVYVPEYVRKSWYGKEHIRREMYEILERLDDPQEYTSSQEAWDAMEGLISKMIAIRQQWRQTYLEIKGVGQLFIAVSGVWK